MSAHAETLAPVKVTRAEVEDFFYHEAALLDEWKLKEWEALLTDDATYYVPPNDDLAGSHKDTLYIISDDRERIRQRIIRVLDPNCHAEFPKSRTCRLITNVRINSVDGDLVTASANFICYRYRRYQREFSYVGTYRYTLRKDGDSFRIKERRVFLHAHELGRLGSVSFIL
ncbi:MULTISPECIES: aromatic-ring-hydroxylating dioxygenase subunit beta [unclassified Beijerinckia]|uniref:aromatic-ring-hydroxylating dioxygenase subunit beta n=1 Tax=unclassified Beijerinckia TaxID=2638183 RepID=UPI0008988184|nr:MULTISPECIES: aromatic-ring-hydroxylating dioxygenase subunit beta [unclassified Beijerinckia]MDH7796643.1 p-cumate 2,3-dioxygenase beta subunit [Beijerinckia sp. GAS462]SEC53877.1 p-cumate 2,3-dioxygenase beta subunit [Beijerinckia sp. 28-YEA-48]